MKETVKDYVPVDSESVTHNMWVLLMFRSVMVPSLDNDHMSSAPFSYIYFNILINIQLAVQRQLRIAEQYIENVALGEFPKRVGR